MASIRVPRHNGHTRRDVAIRSASRSTSSVVIAHLGIGRGRPLVSRDGNGAGGRVVGAGNDDGYLNGAGDVVDGAGVCSYTIDELPPGFCVELYGGETGFDFVKLIDSIRASRSSNSTLLVEPHDLQCKSRTPAKVCVVITRFIPPQ